MVYENSISGLQYILKNQSETSQSIKQIYKHKVKHNLETNPNFNFKNSKMPFYIHKKVMENCWI